MSKTSSHKHTKHRRLTKSPTLRDAAAIASAPLPRRQLPDVTFLQTPSDPLTWSDTDTIDLLPSDDARRWSPEPFQAARTIFGTRQRLTTPRIQKRAQRRSSPFAVPSFPTYALEVGKPTRVSFCIRRKRRREVLAAKGRLGSGQMKKKNLRWHSSIHC